MIKFKQHYKWMMAVVVIYAIIFALHSGIYAFMNYYTVFNGDSSSYANAINKLRPMFDGISLIIAIRVTSVCVLLLAGFLLSSKCSVLAFTAAFYGMFIVAYIAILLISVFSGQEIYTNTLRSGFVNHSAVPMALAAIAFYLLQHKRKYCGLIVITGLLLVLTLPNILSWTGNIVVLNFAWCIIAIMPFCACLISYSTQIAGWIRKRTLAC